nr:hypothetical protein [Tanacetum cinerariifolium]
DYTSAITPNEHVLSTEEPDNSLSMGDEYLDTIPAMESDQFIKSSVENLIPIPSESEDNIIFGLPPCVAITPNEPVDSLSMGDEHLNTVLVTKSDEFIKSSVENLVPNPTFLNDDHSSDFQTKSSSTSLNSLLEETHTFDNSLPEFTTFSNVLYDAEYESDSSDDQSCSDEDILKKIISKPLSKEEIIPMESLRTHDSSLPISSKIDSLLDEF